MAENVNFSVLKSLVPTSSRNIEWEEIENCALNSILKEMSQTMQNPEYHAEGDVLAHTKMVCEKLVMDEEYQRLSNDDKTVVFIATLLHDIGKTRCTKLIDGKLSSPHHSRVGSVMARQILWQTFGLAGTKENQNLRESICNLIRYHSFPPYAMEAKDPERRILKIASNGELASGFSIRKLCMLERADVLGRKSKDTNSHLNKVEYCRMLAEDLSVLDKPYHFASNFSRRAYFLGKTDWRDAEMYNGNFGEVILMSGLPASGKDYWIEKNVPDMPMISLDEIRRKNKISPTENQTQVYLEAKEKAKEYLRKKVPFVWNATNIIPDTRNKQISLFEEYHASVKTVFLETSWDDGLSRNKERQHKVPENVIEKMLSKLELPECYESESVVWETN